MDISKALKNYVCAYLELPQRQPKMVSIGGGTGQPPLLSGLKAHTSEITAIVTMADSGGSSGRLRRLLGVPPFGDLRNCLAALANEEEMMTKLLNYRFKGNRYDENEGALGGQNFGNLFLTALTDISGDLEKALDEAYRILKIKGKVMPSTQDNVHIWAETTSGDKIYGEETIDLGKYNGERTLARLHLDPENASGYARAIEAIAQADLITAGPGDLYTSIMPNLLVKGIRDAILNSTAKKVFVVNIANKPFETPNYKLTDYIKAVKLHTGEMLFKTYLANNNFAPEIPENLNYHYVAVDRQQAEQTGVHIIEADLVSEAFALHHDSTKLASAIMNLVQS